MDALSDDEYAALAQFRKAVRLFLRGAERAARDLGLNRSQHELLLAIRGAPDRTAPSVSWLADELQLEVHSVSGLLQRAERAGLVALSKVAGDGRGRQVTLTPDGERLLAQLFTVHHDEFFEARRRLLASIEAVHKRARDGGRPGAG